MGTAQAGQGSWGKEGGEKGTGEIRLNWKDLSRAASMLIYTEQSLTLPPRFFTQRCRTSDTHPTPSGATLAPDPSPPSHLTHLLPHP